MTSGSGKLAFWRHQHSSLLLAVSLTLLASAAPSFTSAIQEIAPSRVVLVEVTDDKGHPMVDLDADDFVIEEKGESREVLSVFVADYPVVVMMDNGSHARRDIEIVREAISNFVRRIGQRPVVLATLANPPVILGSFDDEPATVLERIRDLDTRPTTVLHPVEAVANTVSVLESTGAPFSTIVVVATREMHASQAESTDMLGAIFSSGVIVHAVSRRAPSSAPQGRGFRPRFDGDLLRDLTEQTGGQFTTVFSSASYSVALDRVADRLAGEMMVQYLVPSGSDAGVEVRVGVTVPGAHVRGLGVSQ